MWSAPEFHFREGSFRLTSLEKGDFVCMLLFPLMSLDGYYDLYVCIDAFLMYVMLSLYSKGCHGVVEVCHGVKGSEENYHAVSCSLLKLTYYMEVT